MFGDWLTNFFNKLVNKNNKTVHLVQMENGREEIIGVFISVTEAEKYAQEKGLEGYKVIPRGRVEY